MRCLFARRGTTLTELMVATVILSIGILGLFGAFRYISRSIFVSRAQSLATNLGQERIETLKNLSYYALQLTTAPATEASFSPAILYDTANYAPETIAIGGITYTRYTYVSMAILTNGDITEVAATYPDTGLKQIVVSVVWTENGAKKRWALRNLLENPNVNPLDSTITGTISRSGGGVVASAVVAVEQNADWSATTDASGVYSFQVYHGTYTVRASSSGFSDSVSASITASRGGTATVPLTLTPIASGTVTGTVWYNSDLVISQVVAATSTQVGSGETREVEYVELYNPTTGPIDIGATTTPYPKPVVLLYWNNAGATRWDWPVALGNSFDMVNVTTYVPPGRYYLIANATSFLINGQWVAADAYYDSALTYPDYIINNKAGSIVLYRISTNLFTDYVGWADASASGPPLYEGTYIPNAAGSDGLGNPAGKQIVRVSSPAASAATIMTYGRAYDSSSNYRDFLYESAGFTGFSIPPKNSASGAFTTIAGKVPSLLGSTYVSASDPNSGSTIAYTAYITSGALSLPYTRFGLTGVSTGTWSVSAAYGSYAAYYDGVAVNQNSVTAIPNSATTPAWPAANMYHVQLNSTTAAGFVKGVVTTTSNQALGSIIVQGGGASKTTGSNGVYFMPVSTGTVTVVANPDNANLAYVQEIAVLSITEGALTTQNFSLGLGGRLTGYITSGTSPLPSIPVTATFGSGSQAGAGTTDSSGMFTLRNISTGSYTVMPVLESGQDANPNSISVNMTSTGTVFVGTFTISGSFGNIAGTVSDASGLLTSGAMILASTSVIASSPATIYGSSAPAMAPLYMVSSKADGTYTLPVRGGATAYYLSAFIPVLSQSGSVSITTKAYSGISVSPSLTTTRNIAIP